MARHRNLCMPLVLLTAVAASAACNAGPSVNGTFDRNYNVTGPIRLEITNASGDVDITGSSDGKVHVRGDVRASGFGFDNPQKRLDDTVANPPIEQTGDTIRIGKEMSRMRNVSIAYVIQVPRDTEVSATVASGAQTIRGVRGLRAHVSTGPSGRRQLLGIENGLWRCATRHPGLGESPYFSRSGLRGDSFRHSNRGGGTGKAFPPCTHGQRWRSRGHPYRLGRNSHHWHKIVLYTCQVPALEEK